MKAILKTPELLDTLIEINNIAPIAQKDFNFFEKFPAQMMTLTQFLPINEERGMQTVKQNISLNQYIHTGKKGYGVVSPQIVATKATKATEHNKISSYVQEKFIQKTLPEILDSFSNTQEIVDIFDRYDIASLLGEEATQTT